MLTWNHTEKISTDNVVLIRRQEGITTDSYVKLVRSVTNRIKNLWNPIEIEIFQ